MAKSLNLYIKSLHAYKNRLKKQTESLGISLIKLDDLIRDSEDELYRARDAAVDDLAEQRELASPTEEGKLEELIDTLEDGGPADRDALRGIREALVDDWQKEFDKLSEYIATLEELLA